MSDFQFDERDNLDTNKKAFARYQNLSASETGMMGFLIRHGWAKDENVAKFVLIGVALFFFAASAVVLIFFK